MQPGFLAAFAAAVAQNAIIAENQDIGNELLVALVLLRLAAIEVSDLKWRSDDGQVFRDVEAQSLKDAELLKELSFETKHSFFCSHGSFAFRVSMMLKMTQESPRAKVVLNFS